MISGSNINGPNRYPRLRSYIKIVYTPFHDMIFFVLLVLSKTDFVSTGPPNLY
jgi:hypothetical protein